jgi:hypothetical protein
MFQRLNASLVFLVCLSLPVQADDRARPASAYREVMDAQYAARQPPLAARAEEAQRIYDAYLQSIGKPRRDPSTSSGATVSSPSR